MLNNEAKLNSKIFDNDVELVPIRNGYGDGLVVVGEKDGMNFCMSRKLYKIILFTRSVIPCVSTGVASVV